MKKLLALLTVIVVLTALCVGCAPAENTSSDVPGTSEGTPVDDTTPPATDSTQTPTETTAGPTTDVETPDDSKPAEESGDNTEISFDDLLANS